MFSVEKEPFEVDENYAEFQDVCSRLKDHAFPSPWNFFFKRPETNDFTTEVSELFIEDVNSLKEDFNTSTQLLPAKLSDVSFDVSKTQVISTDILLDRRKVNRLKESLMSAVEDNTIEHLKDFDIFFVTSSSQIPMLFKILDVSALNDAAVSLLLNAFLQYKDQISVATATALVHYIICPLIFEIKKINPRFLLATILKYSEVYPKSVVDEIMIPYSKEKTSDDVQSEILLQIAKTSLPNEYVPYAIKNVLENALPIDNAFAMLQSLIERKVHQDTALNDLLLKTLLNWTSICNKNVKFTKLLTSILSVYGKEFTEQQILLCDEVVKNNKTIIKKAAENLLKRLKNEYS